MMTAPFKNYKTEQKFGTNVLEIRVFLYTNKMSYDIIRVALCCLLYPGYVEVILVQNEQKSFMEHKTFKLHSEYKPTGDQPQAIAELVEGFKKGNQFQTLLGVTGSGKTFTMANVIAALNKPTLVIAHNKTLAGQLYGEFKEFFPENAVEYFVS